jgi:hypothetical protein
MNRTDSTHEQILNLSMEGKKRKKEAQLSEKSDEAEEFISKQ